MKTIQIQCVTQVWYGFGYMSPYRHTEDQGFEEDMRQHASGYMLIHNRVY